MKINRAKLADNVFTSIRRRIYSASISGAWRVNLDHISAQHVKDLLALGLAVDHYDGARRTKAFWTVSWEDES